MPMRLELPDQVEDQAHHQLDLLNSYTDVIDMPKCIIGHEDTLWLLHLILNLLVFWDRIAGHQICVPRI